MVLFCHGTGEAARRASGQRSALSELSVFPAPSRGQYLRHHLDPASGAPARPGRVNQDYRRPVKRGNFLPAPTGRTAKLFLTRASVIALADTRSYSLGRRRFATQMPGHKANQPSGLCASRSPVPDAIYLGNGSLRCPTSATAPCVALAPASLQSSCLPAVVLHPCSRVFSAFLPEQMLWRERQILCAPARRGSTACRSLTAASLKSEALIAPSNI